MLLLLSKSTLLMKYLSFLQREDLKAVVNYLRTDGNVSCIALWGRSMGAVTRCAHCVQTNLTMNE